PVGPFQDRARDVRRPRREIDDVDPLAALPVAAEALEVPERRVRVAEEGVDAADELERPLELARIDIRCIHPFMLAPPDEHSTPGRPGAAAGSRADADATLAGVDRKIAAVDAGSHLVSAGVGIVVLEHFLGAGVEL